MLQTLLESGDMADKIRSRHRDARSGDSQATDRQKAREERTSIVASA